MAYQVRQSHLHTFKQSWLFNNLKNTTNSVYILIDDYDKLRNLKLEDWFADIDVTKGLWLGPGLENQSLFECEEVRSEDRKYNFEGLGFSLK